MKFTLENNLLITHEDKCVLKISIHVLIQKSCGQTIKTTHKFPAHRSIHTLTIFYNFEPWWYLRNDIKITKILKLQMPMSVRSLLRNFVIIRQSSCYQKRPNTFVDTNWINTSRIFMILVPFASVFRALFDGIKILKNRYILIYFVASKVLPLIR